MISVSISSSTKGLKQQEMDTALPQFPKLLQSRLREDGQRQSGVEAIRRPLCCDAQAVSGAGHGTNPLAREREAERVASNGFNQLIERR
jgi:hypothetical protein